MKPMDVVLKGSQAQRVDLLQAHRVPDPDMGSLEGAAGLPCGDQQLVGVDGHALDVSGVAKAKVDDVGASRKVSPNVNRLFAFCPRIFNNCLK